MHNIFEAKFGINATKDIDIRPSIFLPGTLQNNVKRLKGPRD